MELCEEVYREYYLKIYCSENIFFPAETIGSQKCKKNMKNNFKCLA